jgi:hypothetical protein
MSHALHEPPTSGADFADLIPLSKVPSLLRQIARRHGAEIAYPTLWRWTKKGVRGHRLRTICVGVTRCTRRDWLMEFFEELAGNSEPVVREVRPPARRRREIETAKRSLAEARIA